MTSFDISQFKNIRQIGSRYEKQLARLRGYKYDTSFVETAIDKSFENLHGGFNSFVIYGEPQSGKTEMMICLTAKLLDEGQKVIIVLLNDNVELLKQNLQRFKLSGIGPAPKNFTDIIDPTVRIGENEWIIFCKKNAKDLPKLIEKLKGIPSKVIIDDECDYASPNTKINRGKISRINALIEEILGSNGTYIGVTATPARLDLNNTFDNANDRWVNFPPHSNYTGQYVFFPVKLGERLAYKLNLLPDQGDGPQHLRKALFSFFVNVAYLNCEAGIDEKNYCMLVHTSGKRVDHSEDYKQTVKIVNILKNNEDSKYESYVKMLWEMAKERFDVNCANEIVHYILRNILRSSVVVMNSDKGKNADYSDATNPTVPFTIAIGGNIVSRGVTFKNLLSMFFTRDVKHKIQQDTYIQRARMFGSRELYIKHFELSIPEKLYLDWHKCFVFHRLALESINSGNGVPVWLEDRRVRAVSPVSIDKSTVTIDSGEMGFDIFDIAPSTDKLVNDAYNGIRKNLDILKELSEVLGNKAMPYYVIDYVQSFMPEGDGSIAIHKSAQAYSSANQETIERAKGFIGTPQLEIGKFPKAIHHFKIFHNQNNKSRIFYRYVGNIKFLKSLG